MPQLERWGVWIPGSVGGNFRKVESWKKVSTSLTCFGIPLTVSVQFAVGLIQSCRTRDTKTPFLNTALTGNDGFLGRPLTDSELAEESMGGMFGGSGTTANTFAYLLYATLQQPKLVKRLKHELQEAFPDSGHTVPLAAVRYTLCIKVHTNTFVDMLVTTAPTSCHQRDVTSVPYHHCHTTSNSSSGHCCCQRTHTSWCTSHIACLTVRLPDLITGNRRHSKLHHSP